MLKPVLWVFNQVRETYRAPPSLHPLHRGTRVHFAHLRLLYQVLHSPLIAVARVDLPVAHHAAENRLSDSDPAGDRTLTEPGDFPPRIELLVVPAVVPAVGLHRYAVVFDVVLRRAGRTHAVLRAIGRPLGFLALTVVDDLVLQVLADGRSPLLSFSAGDGTLKSNAFGYVYGFVSVRKL